jgi:tetratricopeptide (TPR) repeat protein
VKRLFLVFVVGFCSFLLFLQAKDALMLKGIVGMLEKQPSAIAQRAYLLKVTLQVIRQAPFLGHGLNSFQAVISAVSNPYVVPPAVHAHSLYLNILAELGIVGLALFLSFVILVIKGPFYSSFLLKVALLAFFFHNIVEYNFPPPPFQVLFYLLCAAIMRGKAPEPSLLRIRGSAARIVPALLTLYFILVHLFPAVGFILLGRAEAAIQRRDAPKALKYLFASTYFGYSVPLLHADTAKLLTDAYFSSDVKDANLLKIAEKNYLKALALNSLDGPLYIDVAGFYASTGRPDKAQDYLSEVIGKYPDHQEYQVALARFYAGQGRGKEAIQILEASEAFLQKYAPLLPLRVNILVGLAQLYHQQGDRVRSEDSIAKARRLKDVLEEPGLLKEQTKDPDASSPR